MPESKVCTKCGLGKPLDEFRIKTDSKSGRTTQCKTCLRAKAKVHRDENKELIRESRQKFYLANKEHINSKNMVNYYKDSQKRCAANRQWYANNKDKMRTYRQNYYSENRMSIIQKSRCYFEANKSAMVLYKNKYHAKQRELLHSAYIKTLVVQNTGLNPQEVPQDQVDLTRVSILIKRKVKEMKDGN